MKNNAKSNGDMGKHGAIGHFIGVKRYSCGTCINTLPEGIYIFGHTHIQWNMQVGKHLFINPGSCGLPLDCTEFGAPYTLLTVENGIASVEERRVKYDVYSLIEKAKATEQYEKVPIWSEVIFKEWMTGYEKLFFFLKYVEEFAQRIGDERRPFDHDTWQALHRNGCRCHCRRNHRQGRVRSKGCPARA